MAYIVLAGLCVFVLLLQRNHQQCNNTLHKVDMHQMVLQHRLPSPIVICQTQKFLWEDLTLILPMQNSGSHLARGRGAKISFAKGWSVEHPSPENDSVYRSNITLCAYELNVEHPQGAQQRMQYKNKMEQLLELRQFVFPGVEIQQTSSLERTLVVNGTEVIMESKIMVVMVTVHHKVKIPCMLLEQLMGHPPIAMGTTNSQLAEL